MKDTTLLNHAEKMNVPFVDLQAWALVNKITDKMNKRICLQPTVIEIGVRHAVSDNVAPTKIIQFLKESANDNYEMISDIIGCELTNQVKRFS